MKKLTVSIGESTNTVGNVWNVFNKTTFSNKHVSNIF